MQEVDPRENRGLPMKGKQEVAQGDRAEGKNFNLALELFFLFFFF